MKYTFFMILIIILLFCEKNTLYCTNISWSKVFLLIMQTNHEIAA